MLDEIKKSVQHDCTHNDGIMISVTLKEMIWLMNQAEKVERLEAIIDIKEIKIGDLEQEIFKLKEIVKNE
jgi:hypothetical protein